MSQNMNLHESEALKALLPKCHKKDRKAQEELFRLTYPFALSICLRYSANCDEAKEIVNDGFFKVFSQLDKYNAELSFAGWMRKIMINCAIDHFRKIKRYNERHPDLSHMKDEPQVEGILDKISAEEIITMVQELPPAYRMVFTLFAVEEYTHKEIAEKLGISEGTSKSNYSKAKLKIKNRLIAINSLLEEQYGA